jgi:thiol:disulfide interchange protein
LQPFLFRPAQHPDPWQNFDHARFESLYGQQNLILDFTADWCPNCKFLEKTVLTPEKSAKFAQEHNAVLCAWT